MMANGDILRIMVNIGSGNGLLPIGSKPLLEQMFTYYQKCFVAFSWEQFHKKGSWTVTCLEITLLKLPPHLPEA